MSKKKYFWLKLHKDFFKSKEIKKLRKIAGGDTFVIIYLKMQLLSIENNGLIEYEEIEPTFAEELALELDEDDANVNATLLFLESRGMIKEVDEAVFSIPHVVDLIGSETPQARSMRKKRSIENQPVTPKNVTELQDCYTGVKKSEQNVTLEKEKELELRVRVREDIPTCPEPTILCFDTFWDMYGKKDGRKNCENKYKKIKEEDRHKIKEHVPKYVSSTPEVKFRKNPMTYLNGEHWNDEIVSNINTQKGVPVRDEYKESEFDVNQFLVN
jgi:predicted phage replisome organizer